MVELVLHQVGHLTKLGQESAEEAYLVHGADVGRDIAAVVEDLQEGGLVVRVGLEGPIHQRHLLTEQLGQVGVELKSPFLGLQEGPKNPAPILTQDAAVHHVELPVQDSESIELLGGRCAAFGFSTFGFACLRGSRAGDQRQSLFEGAGGEVQVAGVGVVFPHEGLGAGPGRTVRKAQAQSDSRLDDGRQSFGGPAGDVMQLIAGAQQEVVGRLHLLAVGGAEELGFLEVHERTGPVLEVGHPEEVLKVTEAADAVFDVGFLQGR